MKEQLYHLPHINSTGVQIPGAYSFLAFDVRSDSQNLCWKLVDRDMHQTMRCLEPVLWHNRIVMNPDDKVDPDDAGSKPFLDVCQEEIGARFDTVVFWSGFIIDRLYLWDKDIDMRNQKPVDIAARLCRVFLTCWMKKQLDAEDRHDEDEREQALLAQAMLWRSYWQALDQIASEPAYIHADRQARDSNRNLTEDFLNGRENAWLKKWARERLLLQERSRALRAWQRICLIDDRIHNRFFEDMFCIWQQRRERWQRLSAQEEHDTTHNQPQYVEEPCAFANWQEQREEEVDLLVWRHKPANELRWPATDTLDGRRRLRYLVVNWYRPRYMIPEARRIEHALYQAEHPPTSVWGEWRRSGAYIGRWLFYGMGRLYAGIGIGFAAVVLQSDTWSVLYEGVQRYPPGAVIVTVVFGVLLYCYLSTNIRGKVGTRAHSRAWSLWWHGEIVAVLISTLLTWILSPLFLDDNQRIVTTPWHWLLVPLLLAQFALFIGIFTQLIFDEKPTTTPLDPP